MSQIYKPGAGGGGGGGIETIAGDTGSITGTNVTIFADNASNNCGGTVLFENSGTVSTLKVTDAVSNTFVGLNCGASGGVSGNCTGFGAACLSSVNNSTSFNSAFGFAAMADFVGDNANGENTAIGDGSLNSLVNGANNTALGSDSADAYTTNESNNIIIGNSGVIGDNNTIRIGLDGSGDRQQDTCFIAGIIGNTVTNALPVTIDSVTGQLGVGASTSPTILSVAMNTLQSLTDAGTGGLQTIVYDTVLVDTASGYAAGVYTVPTTGVYQCSVTSNFLSTAGFLNCDVFVNKNAGTFQFHGVSTATVSDPNTTILNASMILSLTAGDTLNISVFAQTVGATNFSCVGIGNGYYNTFGLSLL